MRIFCIRVPHLGPGQGLLAHLLDMRPSALPSAAHAPHRRVSPLCRAFAHWSRHLVAPTRRAPSPSAPRRSICTRCGRAAGHCVHRPAPKEVLVGYDGEPQAPARRLAPHGRQRRVPVAADALVHRQEAQCEAQARRQLPQHVRQLSGVLDPQRRSRPPRRQVAAGGPRPPCAAPRPRRRRRSGGRTAPALSAGGGGRRAPRGRKHRSGGHLRVTESRGGVSWTGERWGEAGDVRCPDCGEAVRMAPP